jgi:hypothetical protein
VGLPKQPDVIVRTPTAVYIGERAVIEVVVEATKETKVDFIDVKIRGVQGWLRGAAESSYGQTATFPTLGKRLADEGVLTVGTHSFSVSFTLPPGTAPSHRIRPANANLYVDVYVSIPWWPDGKYSFTLPTRLPPAATAQRTPVHVRVPFDVAGDEPRIEVALASTTLVAGETMVGSIAVFHLPDDKPRELDVSFEPFLTLRTGRRYYEMWGDGYRTTLTLPAGTAGTAVPIRVGLPGAITPSFTAVTHDVKWFVRLKIGSLFTTKLEARIPILLLDTRAAATLPALTTAPRLADERVLSVFERFAHSTLGSAAPMTLVADEREAFPDEQPAVTRAAGQGELRVGYAYRGTDGTFLVARVTYAPLGLGLSITPSSAIRSMLTSDIEVGVAEWDRVHRVDARDATQAVPFLRPLVPTPPIGDLVRWTDDEIVYERSVTTVSVEDLAEIVQRLGRLAHDVETARAAIVPPAGIAADLASWGGLATRLASTLCAGDLSITGMLDTTPVDLGLVFDERHRPTAMRVSVGDTKLATERAREATLSIARPSTATADGIASERLASILATWSPDIVSLELAQGVAAASLPVDAGGSDATRVRELIRALQGLLAALDESAGPYR